MTGNVTVPFLHLQKQNTLISKRLTDALTAFIESGTYINGQRVLDFESQFAKYVGTSHAIGVANCLDGLELVLKALGIQPGDEIIVPSNTYIATWLAIMNVGAVPVPVEPDIRTYNIDPSLIIEKITSRTRGILVVHLYGMACDMDNIKAIADRHNLIIVEDSAQAHGASYKGRLTGSLGDASAFSFFPSKNLGALGDAGIITTNRLDVYTYCSIARNYGSEVKYYNKMIGRNSRLDELQAAFLSVKLEMLDDENKRRRRLAQIYFERLGSIAGEICLPEVLADCEHVWHLFVVRVADRKGLSDYLASRGVSTMYHYPVPPHKQEALQGLSLGELNLPISEEIHRTCISLPISGYHTEDEIHYTCDSVLDYFRL